MKYFFSVVSIALIPFCLCSQSCLPGGITFVTQAEVDNFPVNHPGCKVIEGNVNILSSGVQQLSGLAQIEHIEGDLLISGNEQLLHLDGLSQLTTVGGDCRIQNNPLLTHFDGLSNLSAVEGTFFYIGNNAALENIEGLAELDSVSGIFQVWGHPELTSLKGLGQLKKTGGNLAVFNNDKLLVLEGLDSLTLVEGDLRIENNVMLNNISTLNHPVTIQGALVITGNTLLGECAVRSVCDYLDAPATFTAISGNNIGCLSVQEVEAACQVLSVYNPAHLFYSAYPNPVSSLSPVHFTYELDENTRLQIEMLDLFGRVRAVQFFGQRTAGRHVETFTLPADLPNGIYQLNLRSDKGWATVKIIVEN